VSSRYIAKQLQNESPIDTIVSGRWNGSYQGYTARVSVRDQVVFDNFRPWLLSFARRQRYYKLSATTGARMDLRGPVDKAGEGRAGTRSLAPVLPGLRLT